MVMIDFWYIKSLKFQPQQALPNVYRAVLPLNRVGRSGCEKEPGGGRQGKRGGNEQKPRAARICRRLRGWLCTATGFAQCTTIKSGK